MVSDISKEHTTVTFEGQESKKIFWVGWLVVPNILKALCSFEMLGAMNLATLSHSRTSKLSATLL